MVSFNKLTRDNLLFYLLFLILSLFYIQILYTSSVNVIGDRWAYNNLFINYSAGFVRRGLLGEIFLFLNKNFNISPLAFFPKIFFLCYFLQLLIFLKLIFKFKKYNLFLIFLILNPSLLLFYVYETNVIMVKDIFITLSILIHALIISNKSLNYSNYKKFLIFLIFPIITINIFIHENQLLFLPFHILLSSYFLKEKNFDFKITNLLNSYYFFLIPLLIILFSSVSYDKLLVINESVKDFNAVIPNQVAGNINLLIGGFIKWHFFYHDIYNFIRLLFCLVMSLFIFYLLFHNFVLKGIFYSSRFNLKNYIYFILPSFIIFIVMLDHGRSIHLLLIHMLSFYLILNVNFIKFEFFYNKLFQNFFLKNLIILFLIFYLFFWYLPQGGGFYGIGNFSSLFKSGIMEKFLQLFLITYNFIDHNIINLPRIII